MTITQTIRMDLSGRQAPETVKTVQGDCYSRDVELRLYQNGTPWAVPELAQPVISYCKSDGTFGQYDTMPNGDPAWSVSENVLTIHLVPQVMTALGTVVMAVQLMLDEQILNTFGFLVQVHPNPEAGSGDAADQESENYWNVLLTGKVSSAGWPANAYLGTDNDGNVVARAASDALPSVGEGDDGKILQVVGGVWSARMLEPAEEVAY